MDELLTRFKYEAAGRINAFFEAYDSNTNLSEVCALTNNFRSWIEVSSKASEFSFLKEAKRNLHARLSSIIEYLMQKVPPTLLLLDLVMIPPPSTLQAPLVSSEPTLDVGSVSGSKKTLNSEEFILKTLELLIATNSEVNERLKHQDEKKSKMEGILEEILSRLPPPHNP